MPEPRTDASTPGHPRVYTSRGQVDGEDWASVSRALNQRMAARRMGQQELAQLSGVSVSTLRQLQHGAGRRVQNRTLAAICAALDWPEDHLLGVLVSTRPAAPTGDQPTTDALLSALQRIEAALDKLSGRLAIVETLLRDSID